MDGNLICSKIASNLWSDVNCIFNAWLLTLGFSLPQISLIWWDLIIRKPKLHQTCCDCCRNELVSVQQVLTSAIANKEIQQSIRSTSSIISQCLWGLWFQLYRWNRYVSLKTWRPPAVVDKIITKQKKLIMGFCDVAQFMFLLLRPESRL